MKSEKVLQAATRKSMRTSRSRLVIERALLLMKNSHFEEADLLVSTELLFSGSDSELWLVAGLARIQKGNYRTALSAFQMSAWLDDNALARTMIGELAAL